MSSEANTKSIAAVGRKSASIQSFDPICDTYVLFQCAPILMHVSAQVVAVQHRQHLQSVQKFILVEVVQTVHWKDWC